MMKNGIKNSSIINYFQNTKFQIKIWMLKVLKIYFILNFIIDYQDHLQVILFDYKLGFIFAGPFLAFQSLGYIKPKLRGKLLLLLGLGAT